jgi:hypothetical protein
MNNDSLTLARDPRQLTDFNGFASAQLAEAEHMAAASRPVAEDPA